MKMYTTGSRVDREFLPLFNGGEAWPILDELGSEDSARLRAGLRQMDADGHYTVVLAATSRNAAISEWRDGLADLAQSLKCAALEDGTESAPALLRLAAHFDNLRQYEPRFRD